MLKWNGGGVVVEGRQLFKVDLASVDVCGVDPLRGRLDIDGVNKIDKLFGCQIRVVDLLLLLLGAINWSLHTRSTHRFAIG